MIASSQIQDVNGTSQQQFRVCEGPIVSMLLLIEFKSALTGPFAATYPSSLFEKLDLLPRH
jgi:hypothetical protein